jgi:predicted transcriptional regulator
MLRIILFNMKTEKATKARKNMGRDTDHELLGYLGDNPAKTIYELSKELDWSTGKVQKSIKRLDNKLTMDVDGDVESGRIRKRYRAI